MSGLFGSLSMAARALDAQRFGLDVTGQNIANVNTPGYTRRSALFEAIPPYNKWSAGNGVQIDGLRAMRDERLERRLQQELPAEGREAAIAQTLAVVETALGKSGQSIDASLSAFFDAVGRLAADPTSAIERQTTVSQAQALAGSFKDMAGRLDQARRDADSGIRDAVGKVNDLVDRIAKLNEAISIASVNGAGVEELRDSQSEAVKSLAGLLDIGTIPRADGGVDVSFGNGRPLVVGANTYKIDVTSTPPSGFAALLSDGTPVTSEVTGGSIAGLLQARDVLIPGYLDRLDTLAYSVVTQVNAVHQTGYDMNGATGADFFTALPSAAGASRNISVSAGVVADPRTIATGGTAVAGDNAVARKMADLRDSRVLSGGTATFSDAWGALVYRVGADSKAAADDQSSRAEVVRQIQLLREQVSGVSLDEEAMMMMKFQRAYEANARFFQAIDSALETLLSLHR